LFSFLQQTPLPYRVEDLESSEAYTNFSFFEAYFSNYIEGTEFELEEAQDIIFHNLIIPHRSGDTHDIRGTFAILNNPKALMRTPKNFDEFQDLLQERHGILLEGRPDKNPGKFKTRANRAGNTSFVEPNLVRGTLQKALEPYLALNHPLAKAIYMMFVVSEVHPFEDGNGRIARIMMNAELVKAKLKRIIIPTIYREDYLLALRKLSRQQIPDAYVRMLDRAQAFSAWLKPQDFAITVQQLQQSKAFFEPEAGSLQWPE
jgi:Fic family protein